MIKDFENSVDNSVSLSLYEWEYFSIRLNKTAQYECIQNLIDYGNPNNQDGYDDKLVFWTWDEPYYGWSSSVNNEHFNDELNNILLDTF